MLKRISIMLIVLLIIFGGIFYGRHWMMAKFVTPQLNKKPPPVVVSAIQAGTQTWTPSISAVGTLVAVHGVNVSSEVAGMVESINFSSGQMVKKGDLLVQLDTSVEKQQLANYESKLALDKSNYERNKAVFDKNAAISASAMQGVQSTYQQSQATVKQQKALIAEKSIRAPFAGKVGIRDVNLGQYISPGTTLVGLQSLDPLYVNFSLPEQDVSSVHDGQVVNVTQADQSATSQHYQGKVIAVDSQINQDTRTVLVQASIPNPKYVLLPGSFVQVNVMLPTKSQVITVPQTAVSYSLYGNTIYVVRKDKNVQKVYPITVQTGDKKGSVVAITSGIKAGEWVVTSGQLKLHAGTEVTIQK